MTSFYLLLGSHDYLHFTDGQTKIQLEENQDVNQV